MNSDENPAKEKKVKRQSPVPPLLRPAARPFRADIIEDGIKLDPEGEAVLKLMEETDEHLFITGRAGTGKTTLLKIFKENTGKKTAVIAPTGVAAVNVGGQTIHSFFALPLGVLQGGKIRRKYGDEVIKNLDLLIIDEVSMVRADLMDAIDHALRINRNERRLPFGGVQVVFFGDLFQLPPVLNEEDKKIYFNFYETPYFFSANVFNRLAPVFIELSTVFRQQDARFVGLLNKIRDKTQNEDELEALNESYIRDPGPAALEKSIILTATNEKAANINRSRLAGLPGKEYSFRAEVTGKFDKSSFPTEAELVLKEGAKVILLRNDPEKRWVNGTLGIVSALDDELVTVSIDGRHFELEPVSWEKIRYEYNPLENKIEELVVGTFTQYPLKLAWAMTIHKSQGQTFDSVVIDLGRGAFAHGQVYVALSRCTSLDGITLSRPIIESDIIFDKRVYDFRKHLMEYKLTVHR